ASVMGMMMPRDRLWFTRSTIIRTARGRHRRQHRDGTTECTRQLRRGEEDIVRGTRLGGFGGQQRELRIGDLELRAESTTESERRELEGLLRIGGVLLPRLEHGA